MNGAINFTIVNLGSGTNTLENDKLCLHFCRDARLPSTDFTDYRGFDFLMNCREPDKL